MSRTETNYKKSASAPPQRDYLRPEEVRACIKEAGKGRWPARDQALISMMWKHGLRVSEATGLRWDAFDWTNGKLNVRRLKNGWPSTHTLATDEIRALKKLKANAKSPYVFESERGNGRMSTDAVARVVALAGERAGLELHVHPHMLRHACGHSLANQGHDTRAIQEFLGHRNISMTVRYTQLAPERRAALMVV